MMKPAAMILAGALVIPLTSAQMDDVVAGRYHHHHHPQISSAHLYGTGSSGTGTIGVPGPIGGVPGPTGPLPGPTGPLPGPTK